MARKLQGVKPVVVAAIASGLQVLGGAYLVPTLRLNSPTRVNGEYDMKAIVAAAKSNWTLRGPVVIDLANVSSNGSPHTSPIKPTEFKALFRSLKDANLVPIAITNASEDVKAMAWRTLQVPSIMGTRLSDDDNIDGERWIAVSTVSQGDETAEYAAVTEEAYSKVTPSADQDLPHNVTTTPTHALSGMMVVEGSVRTGQQIYAKGQGLVVMGSVNSGAEVLADGDIHIYGMLKGRALAGIGGNSHAKVDDLPTIVWLENGMLRFKSVVPGRV
ncbi:hypothetical protein DYB35_004355 [Aphanomyces astaci]|uniref:Septum formation inhibitor MinC C-terminal domain-containing protein n=2 Tax=Aphanomyces astaci TaxID=112090 RepID=A0A3R7E7B7_APHAT|nr:hypothetical protein DYB35_004355 [Aphanomyces astaci]